ncbi:hypothetical protein, partial [Rhizobium leguminosarum]|uniref:hypothetical protein n=1 Tax=Rhizobium leguminosarum TaxID=384 RepID=UPI003F9A897A
MQKDPPRILFLGLTIFSQTGGIEKFNRCFIRVLELLTVSGKKNAQVAVLHDDEPDARYFDPQRFKGYKGNRVSFVISET